MNNAFIVTLMIQTCSVQAQTNKPFNPITQQLILNEIQKEGLTAIKERIDSITAPRTEIKGLYWRRRDLPALTITTIFHKNDITTDPLAQLIFAKIESIEHASGYMPQGKEVDADHFKCATNYLGQDVRYFWLEEQGQRIAAIRVEVEISDKNKLLDLIATCENKNLQ